MSFKRARSAKRRVTRVKNTMNNTIPSTINSVTLHEADEDRTLIRTILELQIYSATNLAARNVGLRISRAPAGTKIGSVSYASSNDDDVSDEEIWDYSANMPARTDTNGDNRIFISKDMKGMRKLRKGDKILLELVASDNNLSTVVGKIIQFFKET